MKSGIFSATKSAKDRITKGEYKPRCKGPGCACELPKPSAGNLPPDSKKTGTA